MHAADRRQIELSTEESAWMNVCVCVSVNETCYICIHFYCMVLFES